MPYLINEFEQRLQEWKKADAEAAKINQQFRQALLNGAAGDYAEELYGEVLKLRRRADALITELLRDMARMRGEWPDSLSSK